MSDLISRHPETHEKRTETHACDSINRQAAIDILAIGEELLKRVLDDVDVVGNEREKYEWGLGLIESYIADMKDLPSVQPTQNTRVNSNSALDTISRQAAVDALDKRFDDMLMKLTTELLQFRRDLRERIPSAQPIDVQEAYYRGKIDGIKECTAKLKKMNEEVANG
jgi:hypothetical protein